MGAMVRVVIVMSPMVMVVTIEKGVGRMHAV
jgi:hypothetical protein